MTNSKMKIYSILLVLINFCNCSGKITKEKCNDLTNFKSNNLIQNTFGTKKLSENIQVNKNSSESQDITKNKQQRYFKDFFNKILEQILIKPPPLQHPDQKKQESDSISTKIAAAFKEAFPLIFKSRDQETNESKHNFIINYEYILKQTNFLISSAFPEIDNIIAKRDSYKKTYEYENTLLNVIISYKTNLTESLLQHIKNNQNLNDTKINKLLFYMDKYIRNHMKLCDTSLLNIPLRYDSDTVHFLRSILPDIYHYFFYKYNHAIALRLYFYYNLINEEQIQMEILKNKDHKGPLIQLKNEPLLIYKHLFDAINESRAVMHLIAKIYENKKNIEIKRTNPNCEIIINENIEQYICDCLKTFTEEIKQNKNLKDSSENLDCEFLEFYYNEKKQIENWKKNMNLE